MLLGVNMFDFNVLICGKTLEVIIFDHYVLGKRRGTAPDAPFNLILWYISKTIPILWE